MAGFLVVASVSHPLRVRELKQVPARLVSLSPFSHPLRVRELKLFRQRQTLCDNPFAPFTGAWIETRHTLLKLPINSVAPFTGAWIETQIRKRIYIVAFRRTLYGCVNWNIKDELLSDFIFVAPFTGAWIETVATERLSHNALSRTLYGCVNWNANTGLLSRLNRCRTLYGCVNDNMQYKFYFFNLIYCKNVFICICRKSPTDSGLSPPSYEELFNKLIFEISGYVKV